MKANMPRTLTSRRMTLQRLTALSGGAALLAALGRARAQVGEKTVRFILPNATGSGIDAITRAAQPALAKALGYPVIVDNQPGAGGIVGVQQLVRAAPDGFTLSIVSNNHVIYPSVYKSVPFDPINDITPIAVIGTTPVVLVVNPSKVPAKTSPEFIALLKAKPDAYNYGSGGNGTILHLASELFLDEAKVQAKHIPYKGVGPMVTDLIGGQIDFATVALPSVQSQLKAGTLRAIGVATAERVPAAPEIPTFVEQSLPGYVIEAWFGFIGPKGLSAGDVKRLHAAVVTAFNAPDVREAMSRQGNVINVSTVEYAGQFFRSELARYAKLVKKAGIEPQ
jgi:tripartite-type tricarboxylate transporter receptor subunit TctC